MACCKGTTVQILKISRLHAVFIADAHTVLHREKPITFTTDFVRASELKQRQFEHNLS